MEEVFYHKIQSLYLRDPANKHRTFLEGQWSMPELGYLQDAQWSWTEKVDGTNVRVIWDGEKVVFGGRTANAQLHNGLVAALIEQFPAALMVAVFGGPAMLCGEGFGEKIQKGGGNYREGQGFVLFDVWCGGMWLTRDSVHGIADKLSCHAVPGVGVGTLHEAVEYVKCRPDSMWGPFTSEGIVMRPTTELQTRNGHRIITKLKCKDFVA